MSFNMESHLASVWNVDKVKVEDAKHPISILITPQMCDIAEQGSATSCTVSATSLFSLQCDYTYTYRGFHFAGVRQKDGTVRTERRVIPKDLYEKVIKPLDDGRPRDQEAGFYMLTVPTGSKALGYDKPRNKNPKRHGNGRQAKQAGTLHTRPYMGRLRVASK